MAEVPPHLLAPGQLCCGPGDPGERRGAMGAGGSCGCGGALCSSLPSPSPPNSGDAV